MRFSMSSSGSRQTSNSWRDHGIATLGLVAGIVFAKGALAGPRHLLLRLRVWLIERKLSNRKLRIVQGDDDKPGFPSSKPPPKSGSDGYLH